MYQIDAAQAAADDAKDELRQERSRFTDELARIKAAKQEELDQIHSRVKQTLAKRDEVIATLRERLEEAEETLRQTQALLGSAQ